MPVGTNNAQQIGAVSLLGARDIYKQLIDTQGDDEWLDFLMLSGKKEKAVAPVYSSAYDDALFSLIDTTGSTVTGSASATVTITNLTTAQSGKIMVGKLLKFANGKVGRVQTLTTSSGRDTITVQSVDGTNLTLAAGGLVSPFSNAQEEGSLQPDPERWNVSFLSNQVQIFRNTARATDIAQASEIELEINGERKLLSLAKLRILQKHRAEQAFAFWMSELSVTKFTDASPALAGAQGYGVQTTRGMDAYIRDFGINDTVATAGTVTLADFTDIEAKLNAARGPVNYLLAGSQAPVGLISDFWKTGITNSQFMVNGRDVDMEVETFMHGGFKFSLKRFNVLGNATVIDPASTIAKNTYFLPMGQTRTRGGGMVDYFRYRWMPVINCGQGTPETAEVNLGALAETPTSGTAVHDVVYQSIAGLEVLAPQKFAKMVTTA